MSRIGHADMPAHGPWNGLLLALIFLLAFSASPARAATVDIGPGVAPTVSVDSQGVAYIVYNDSAATHPSVHL
jgi:hypothetical protein